MAAFNLFLALAKTSTPMSVHRSDGRVDAREYSMVSHVLGKKKKVFHQLTLFSIYSTVE